MYKRHTYMHYKILHRILILNRYLLSIEKCIDQSPVLLPTVSDVPRTDFASVKDYFDSFLLKKPQGEILDGNIKIGDGWASDTGIYEVCFCCTT